MAEEGIVGKREIEKPIDLVEVGDDSSGENRRTMDSSYHLLKLEHPINRKGEVDEGKMSVLILTSPDSLRSLGIKPKKRLVMYMPWYNHIKGDAKFGKDPDLRNYKLNDRGMSRLMSYDPEKLQDLIKS